MARLVLFTLLALTAPRMSTVESATTPSNGSAQKLSMPPPAPLAYPPADEKSPIPDSFLQDPLIVEAVAYVNSVVPSQYLSIPPSKYVSPCTATYDKATAVTNCYWPGNLCVRESTPAFDADVVSCPGANVWGLTYDDGPTENIVNGGNVDDTTALRAALDANNNTKATFFVVGSMGVNYPGQIAETYKAGHQIGLHTWTHWTSTALTNEQFVAELKFSEALVYNSTGVVPRFWRPPCGDIDDRIRAIAHALGYRTVPWTTTPDRDTTDADVDPSDAANDQILVNVKTWFVPQPGFITLEHDISTFTTHLGIEILQAVKDAGSSFPLKMMPVGDCIGQPYYQYGPGSTPSGSPTTNGTAPDGSAATPLNPSSPDTAPAATVVINAPLKGDGRKGAEWSASVLLGAILALALSTY